MEKRLQQFLLAEGITQAQFADSIGVTKASISHILSGRNKPGYDFFCNTIKYYPTLNVEWLLSGKGKMYKSNMVETVSQEPNTQANLFNQTVFQAEEDNTDDAVSMKETSGDKMEELPFPVIQPVVEDNNNESNPQQSSIPAEKAIFSPNNKPRRVVKVILLYDDGTFQDGVL